MSADDSVQWENRYDAIRESGVDYRIVWISEK